MNISPTFAVGKGILVNVDFLYWTGLIVLNTIRWPRCSTARTKKKDLLELIANKETLHLSRDETFSLLLTKIVSAMKLVLLQVNHFNPKPCSRIRKLFDKLQPMWFGILHKKDIINLNQRKSLLNRIFEEGRHLFREKF